MLTMSGAVHIPTPEELRALRERLGLTQAEAADKVGVARRTWMYWENPARDRRPSSSHAKLIKLLADGKL
jgi:DNA-binding XRE family transcriptional regulator